MQIILFSTNGKLSIMVSVGNPFTTAKKDVPAGVPFVIVDSTELPDAPQETWEVDFSNPDGYGGEA